MKSVSGISLAALTGLASAVPYNHASSASASAPGSGPTGTSYASGFDMTTSWANLSPYHSAKTFGVPKGVPEGCDLSQVHVLHRHAERFPTSSPLDGVGMQGFASKLANYTRDHPQTKVGSGPLKFLNSWGYVIGQDTLMESGAATEATSGANFWIKYGRLLYGADSDNVSGWNESLNVYQNGTQRPKPVFRTTDQARILESARWWLSGFFGDRAANSSADLYDLVIIPEEVDYFNNTLASYVSCLGDMTAGDKTAERFIARYTKQARSRLSAFVPSDFNLTASDILAMQNLCVYEHTSLGGSSFCSLFTEQEWKDFAYNVDIQYYGDYAFGSASGRAQGIGYVLELAARLQGELITTSDTSINYTFDNNLEQFPLGQPFYMDMSHDDIILSVVTALGLDHFRYGPHGLPVDIDHAPANRTFSLSDMTPFGARFISEIWTCPTNAKFDTLEPVLYINPDITEEKTERYIRFLLNDAPLPLGGLIGCEKSKNGFCAVSGFLKGVPKLKENAKYQEACFGKYPTGKQVWDGVPIY
ncbi:histidine phosphatase family protein [Aspergillus alliaceus]|uniref:histidine phosphatase family protein n=1 Tax=Petromyces alliaceus TaxID=209559 RepID=UPI0012A42207|nr:histidine phosphatase superfamily [Aspergillus alliaceus]KAB8235163.1 histidine phosphatase superfamily [Aspergillus alliaceus]